MSFTRKTNSIALFATSGDYHAEAKLSYTKNESNRTFTVTVEGVRAYCKYGWNFRSNITIWLGTSSNGDGKVQQTGSIPSSGSNTYKGWLPKSGYANIKVSKTFNYNDDGSVPTVHFYLNAYNSSVQWLNNGKKTPVNVTYSGDIKSEITKIGPKDISPPTVSSWVTGATASAISWGCKSNTNISEWKYKIDGGAWKVFGSAGKSSNGSLNVKPGHHTLQVCGKKASNGKWGYADTLYYDTTLPSINSQSISVSASNKGTLHFKCNYKCDYRLTASGYDTGWINGLATNTNANKSISLINSKEVNYTLTVRRSDNTSLTNSTTIKVDSRLPDIKGLNFIPDSTKSGTLYLSSSYSYQYRYKTSGGWSSWSGTYGANVSASKKLTLSENVNNNVQIQVRRSVNNNLYSDTTYTCDLRLPNIKNKSIQVTADGNAKLSFTSSYSFIYRYYNGVRWSTWSTAYNANSPISINISVPKNANTTVTVHILRTYSGCLGNSTTLSADSRLPSIYNASIAVDFYNTGSLIYSSNFDTTYELKIDKLYSGTLVKGTTLNKKINIFKNKYFNYTLTVRRSDNTSLSSSTKLLVDTMQPTELSCNLKVTGFESGRLTVVPKYNSTLSIEGKNYNVNSNNKLEVDVTLKRDNEGTYNFKLSRRSNKNLTYTISTKYDTKIPTYDVSVSVTGSNKANVLIKSCSHKYDINAFDGNDKFEWGSEINRGSKYITNVPIRDNYCGDYTVRVYRHDIPQIYKDTKVTIDSVLPTIKNLVAYPVRTNGTKARFSGTFNLPVTYVVKGPKGNNVISGGIKLTNEIAHSNVFNVNAGTYEKYTISMSRTSNSNLTNECDVKIDCRIPKITIIPYDDKNNVMVVGSKATITFKNSTELPVYNVKVKYKNKVDNTLHSIRYGDISKDGTLEYKVDIPENFDTESIQLIPGQNYQVFIIAERTLKIDGIGDVKLYGTSETLDFTANGGIWVKDATQFKSGTIYLYNGKWEEVIPYMYSSSESRWIRTK